jgi:hypothetical protein
MHACRRCLSGTTGHPTRRQKFEVQNKIHVRGTYIKTSGAVRQSGSTTLQSKANGRPGSGAWHTHQSNRRSGSWGSYSEIVCDAKPRCRRSRPMHCAALQAILAQATSNSCSRLRRLPVAVLITVAAPATPYPSCSACAPPPRGAAQRITSLKQKSCIHS